MVWWVKVLVAKPDVPSLISKTHVGGRRGPTFDKLSFIPTNKQVN